MIGVVAKLKSDLPDERTDGILDAARDNGSDEQGASQKKNNNVVEGGKRGEKGKCESKRRWASVPMPFIRTRGRVA